LGGLGIAEVVLVGEVVNDEGGDGDLSSDVAELGEESEDGVLALPERTVVGEALGGLRRWERVKSGAELGRGQLKNSPATRSCRRR
jgi:hypothetical protein